MKRSTSALAPVRTLWLNQGLATFCKYAIATTMTHIYPRDSVVHCNSVR